MIKLLKQRGNLIKEGNFKKVMTLEMEINNLKSENIEAYTRPVYAFITFLQEGGYEAAKNFSGNATLLSAKITITEAPEPTDIIWENRHFTE
jgi:Cytosolic domain of 10TM putative phosphate transporter